MSHQEHNQNVYSLTASAHNIGKMRRHLRKGLANKTVLDKHRMKLETTILAKLPDGIPHGNWSAYAQKEPDKFRECLGQDLQTILATIRGLESGYTSLVRSMKPERELIGKIYSSHPGGVPSELDDLECVMVYRYDRWACDTIVSNMTNWWCGRENDWDCGKIAGMRFGFKGQVQYQGFHH